MEAEEVGTQFGYMRLTGGRYNRPGLPVAAGAELERYARLVSVVARQLYLRENPTRKRVPPHFDTALDLRLTDVQEGSVEPVLARPEPEVDLLALFGANDWHEQARRLINEAFAHVNDTDQLPDEFPEAALPDLAQFGRGLRRDERVTLGNARDDIKAVINTETRRKVQSLAKLDELSVEMVLLGRVIGLASAPDQAKLVVEIDGEQRTFSTEVSDQTVWDDLQERLGREEHAPLTALTVVTAQNDQGRVTRISDVLGVELALPPEWEDRIKSLSALVDGWLSPGVAAPSRQVVGRVQALLLACLDADTERPAVYPSGDGGAQLEWRERSRHVELELLNDGTIESVAFSEGSDEITEQSFDTFVPEKIVEYVLGAMNG